MSGSGIHGWSSGKTFSDACAIDSARSQYDCCFVARQSWTCAAIIIPST